METKDTVSSCSVSQEQEIQRLQVKAQLSNEGCMKSLKALQSKFTFLTDTLQDFGQIQQLFNEKKLQTQEVQSNTIQALKVDSIVMENMCYGKENRNSETAFSRLVKESSLDSETKD
ncbi:hypothetical protein Tco_1154368, partial [Tanacetum coccineum]